MGRLNVSNSSNLMTNADSAGSAATLLLSIPPITGRLIVEDVQLELTGKHGEGAPGGHSDYSNGAR